MRAWPIQHWTCTRAQAYADLRSLKCGTLRVNIEHNLVTVCMLLLRNTALFRTGPDGNSAYLLLPLTEPCKPLPALPWLGMAWHGLVDTVACPSL